MLGVSDQIVQWLGVPGPQSVSPDVITTAETVPSVVVSVQIYPDTVPGAAQAFDAAAWNVISPDVIASGATVPATAGLTMYVTTDAVASPGSAPDVDVTKTVPGGAETVGAATGRVVQGLGIGGPQFATAGFIASSAAVPSVAVGMMVFPDVATSAGGAFDVEATRTPGGEVLGSLLSRVVRALGPNLWQQVTAGPAVEAGSVPGPLVAVVGRCDPDFVGSTAVVPDPSVSAVFTITVDPSGYTSQVPSPALYRGRPSKRIAAVTREIRAGSGYGELVAATWAKTLVKRDGVWRQVESPRQSFLDSCDVVLRGGYENVITEQMADELLAAGFGVETVYV